MPKKVDRDSILLWVDLEMTGLDPVKDRILEVAAIVTDWNMEELGTFTAVVKVDEDLIRERMVGDFWEKNKESYNGLVAQNKDGEPATQVEQELLDFLAQFNAETVYLSVNLIHQDRKFIELEWQWLNAKLHYRMLDVSAWKIYFENAMHRKFAKPENHRALDDIRGSIEELKWYLKMIS